MTRTHRVTVGTLCVLLMLLLPGWALRHERSDRVAERAEALAEVEARNAELRTENERLDALVRSLDDDPARLENEVRERLGWVRANEVVIEFTEGTP